MGVNNIFMPISHRLFFSNTSMRAIFRLLRQKINFFWLSALVWGALLFANTNDPIAQLKMQWDLWKLESEEDYYAQKIKEVKAERAEVMGNDTLVEKYARERYLMKKDKEDLYMIVDENNEAIEK